jgi:hypothetical protein
MLTEISDKESSLVLSAGVKASGIRRQEPTDRTATATNDARDGAMSPCADLEEGRHDMMAVEG